MKMLTVIVQIVGILIATSISGNAFADPPSPTINFKGLDAKECKVFEITDMDKNKKGSISQILVHDPFDDFDTPAVVPDAPTTGDRFDTVFNYAVDDKPNPDKVTLTICAAKGNESGDFRITAFDSQEKPQKTTLIVSEQKRNALSMSVPIPNKKVDCSDPKNVVQTDNLKTPTLDCKYDGKDTRITVNNLTRPNERLPSTIAIKIDPPSALFLIVGEFCVLSDEEHLCPADVAFDLEFRGTEDNFVGGEITGIDPSSLFVTGIFANASWLIPIGGAAVAAIFGYALRKRIP